MSKAMKVFVVGVAVTAMVSADCWAAWAGQTCAGRAVCSDVIGGAEAAEVNAADLVRAVRGSEDWIHKVDSIQIRVESKWTRTPRAVAVGGVQSGGDCRCAGVTGSGARALGPSSKGTLEYAIDQQRLRFLDDRPGKCRILKMWDGKQAVSHEQYFNSLKEHYYLGPLPQDIGKGLFSFISWLRSQPHSFWWEPIDVEEHLGYFGYPGEFVTVGRSDYRGVDCYVLDACPREVRGFISGQSYEGYDVGGDQSSYGIIGEVRGLVGQSYRWYVGAEDRRLYGLLRLNSKKPHIEHWLQDYKEVSPGCWLPMTQGCQIYEKDSGGEPCLVFRRELKVVSVRVNEKLPDELFKLELKKDVKVIDERRGRAVTYTYRPEPPALVGRSLPKFAGIDINLAAERTKDKRILVCFWDMNQRPSRYLVRQLAKKAEELKQKDVVVAAVQASQVDGEALRRWVKECNVPFSVGVVEANEEDIRLAWGVRSLPWLILADRKELVTASGFALFELDEELKQISGG